MDIVLDRPGFVPIVRGGLGNQLFTLSAAFVAAKAHGDAPLYLPNPPLYENEHSKKNYAATVFRPFGAIELPLSEIDRRGLAPYRHGPSDGFAPWSPLALPPGTRLDSYYQYWPALQPYERDIRQRILAGLPPPPRDPVPGAAFLHIRRGDYVKLAHIHYVQPMAYYERATMTLLDAASSTGNDIRRIYVITDDPDWAQHQSLFASPLFKVVDLPDELESLAFMARCTAGAIISNSTFSWWGAFLGAYDRRAPVVTPTADRWIAGQSRVQICPQEWIQQPV
jgi:hypothetical protein